MGSLNKPWHNQLLTELAAAGLSYEIFPNDHFELLSLHEGKVVLNLMSLNHPKLPEELVDLQTEHKLKNVQVIHLWEDVWLNKKEQVLSRLKSIIGLNFRIHARKTEVIRLSQKEADEFLSINHLQLSVGARYRYGLAIDNKLVAVACFSGLRKMHNGIINYRSTELIRFANLLETTVIGGFTKLLSHFIKHHQPNDVMSYADRDWSIGSAYERAGFTLVETTTPAAILLDKTTSIRTFPHRLGDISTRDQYLDIFNTGNLKYILYCEKP